MVTARSQAHAKECEIRSKAGRHARGFMDESNIWQIHSGKTHIGVNCGVSYFCPLLLRRYVTINIHLQVAYAVGTSAHFPGPRNDFSDSEQVDLPKTEPLQHRRGSKRNMRYLRHALNPPHLGQSIISSCALPKVTAHHLKKKTGKKATGTLFRALLKRPKTKVNSTRSHSDGVPHLKKITGTLFERS